MIFKWLVKDLKQFVTQGKSNLDDTETKNLEKYECIKEVRIRVRWREAKKEYSSVCLEMHRCICLIPSRDRIYTFISCCRSMLMLSRVMIFEDSEFPFSFPVIASFVCNLLMFCSWKIYSCNKLRLIWILKIEIRRKTISTLVTLYILSIFSLYFELRSTWALKNEIRRRPMSTSVSFFVNFLILLP